MREILRYQPEPKRMVIVDDHKLARQAMRILLEHHLDVDVVEDFAGRRAVERTLELSPVAVLIDLEKASIEDRLEAIRQIQSALPEVRVVVLVGELISPNLHRRVVESGVSGYLSKNTGDLNEILMVVQRALESLPSLPGEEMFEAS